MRWTVYHKGVVIRTIMPLSRSLVRLVDEPLDIFPHLGSHPEVRKSNSAKIYYTYIASKIEWSRYALGVNSLVRSSDHGPLNGVH